MNEYKLLAVVDSPTVNTGFAAVGKALLPRWSPHFARLDIWGINSTGWPHDLPWKIFPGGLDWSDAEKQTQLLNVILEGGYTHVWILQDSFNLSRQGLAENLRLACDRAGAKLIVYFPVDAPPDKSWLRIARVADAAVTYTDYGADAARAADPGVNPRVIPHGVDTEVFKPLVDDVDCGTHASYRALRNEVFGDWAGSEDFILLNVNRNERRKDLPASLAVLKILRDRGVPAKLFLHCPVENGPEKTDLRRVARQLGLKYGEHWATPEGENFSGGVGRMAAADINRTYNAADLVITTTRGEGWGFSITEGAAAGRPVICPDHTSCGEIARRFDVLGRCKQIRRAPLATVAAVNPNDNSRVRWPVEPYAFAALVEEAWQHRAENRYPALAGELKDWLSWDRIAAEWLTVFEEKAKGKMENAELKAEASTDAAG